MNYFIPVESGPAFAVVIPLENGEGFCQNYHRIIQEVRTTFIKSSTALRNDYGSISDLAHNEAEPIYITKNGEGDLVVMSIEA